jgi:hypothetical protein
MALDLTFGTDTSTFDASGRFSLGFDRPEISGVRVPLEHCARCITTPQGALFFDRTMGVRRPMQSLRNSMLTDADLASIASEWGAACKAQVQGVTGARFVLRRLPDGKSIAFGAVVATTAGAFPLNGTAGDALTFLFPVGLTT